MNNSLYISCGAVLISILVALFLYRELLKLKKEIFQINKMKNQITNTDIRFDEMEKKVENINNLLNFSQTTTNQNEFVNNNQLNEFNNEPLNDVEEESDNEIIEEVEEVEEVSDDDEDDDDIEEIQRPDLKN